MENSIKLVCIYIAVACKPSTILNSFTNFMKIQLRYFQYHEMKMDYSQIQDGARETKYF